MNIVSGWAISAVAAGSVFLSVAGLSPRGGYRRKQLMSSFFLSGPAPERDRAGGVRPALEPVLRRLGATRLGRRIPSSDRATRRLVLAGGVASLDALRGLQIVVAVSVGLMVIAVVGVRRPPSLLLALAAALAFARAPEMAVARKAARRQAGIAAAVPDLVELLLATTEAGLGPPLALARTAGVLSGPLGEEIRRVVREVDLGIPWHVAMDHLVDRTEVPALRALTNALARSQRLGSGVERTLRRVVEDLRGQRRLRAEEIARKAPVKMLFPLVFLILPAFLLLTVGPVVLATLRSLH